MSFFDDIRAKVDALLGGAPEEAGNTLEDIKNNVSEQVSGLGEHVEGQFGENNDEQK